jgi:lipopolysaccharide transport system ATP-binding protein
MALEFRGVQYPPFEDLTISAPSGAIIGIVGEKGCGEAALMSLASGAEKPITGEVIAPESRRHLGIRDSLNFAPADLLLLEHTFAQADALVRERARVALDRLRTQGVTALVASHEPELLRQISDEIWWLENGRVVARGNPAEVLEKFHNRIADKFRAWGETLSAPLEPRLRRGDGRAEIVCLETLGANEKPTTVWRSGEAVTVRVAVRYQEPVANPVVGIMIRTRIGLEVYGTNTTLENISIGPCSAGETIRVEFRFGCELCPKEYTVTAASHDPDGTAHDWVDDAVAVLVTDSRYTAGVANLRAKVAVVRLEDKKGPPSSGNDLALGGRAL